MPEQKPIIMYGAPEAVSLKTVTGWVSADGRFFGGNEDLARYRGATHRRCEANPEHKIYAVNSYCEECRQERCQAKFAAMPIKEWAGEPLVIFDSDQYFFDEDSLRDYLIDSDVDFADLKLCICEPNYPSQIDPTDHFCDDLPEDGEIRDDQLLTAFDLLNEMIRQSEPLSWSEGEHAARLPKSLLDEVIAARAAREVLRPGSGRLTGLRGYPGGRAPDLS